MLNQGVFVTSFGSGSRIRTYDLRVMSRPEGCFRNILRHRELTAGQGDTHSHVKVHVYRFCHAFQVVMYKVMYIETGRPPDPWASGIVTGGIKLL